MKYWIQLIALVLFLVGCESRSISDSGYRHPYWWGRPDNPFYKGELTELDILGAAPREAATEENITRALEAAAAPKIKRGDRLILIQSGAPTPDNSLVEEASRYFSLAPFSGIPQTETSGMVESFRLRAA